MKVSDHEAVGSHVERQDAAVVLAVMDGRREPAAVGREQLAVLVRSHQRAVESLQVGVEEVVVIPQRPLPPGVLKRLAVALPREIDPLGVTELVPHEVQPRLAPERQLEEPGHLVQRDAPLHRGVHALRPRLAHAPVHGRVHEREGERLIAHQALIVGFEVAHRGFRVAPRDQADDPGWAPVEVGLVREPSPVVGRTH